MDFVGLKTLSVGTGSSPIRVRVCRAWDAVNPRRKDLISFDMIIADEESTVMFAHVRRTLVGRFRPMLVVGSIYIITGYSVAEVSREYRPVDWPLKIVFTLITLVRVVNKPVPGIPLHGFNFPPMPTVMSRVNDSTFLSDVAGCLVRVDATEPVAGGFLKRELHLKSDICENFKVTIWSDAAEGFLNDYNIDGTTPPLIFVFTSMKAKQYLDLLNYSTTTATKVYVNPEHEYISKLRQLFAGTIPTISLETPLTSLQESVEEAMLSNRMTISEILSGSWSHEKSGYKITFAGTVSSIATNYGWFYFGCRICKTKVEVTDWAYTCTTCNKDLTNPLILYKILCDIDDATGTITCVLLNKVAERMVDSSAMKFFNRLVPDDQAFPREVLDLCGQSHIFRVRLSDYNIRKGGEVFTVCDVFPPVTGVQHRDARAVQSKGTGSSASGAKNRSVDPKGKGKLGMAEGSGEVVSVTPTKHHPPKRKFVPDECEACPV